MNQFFFPFSFSSPPPPESPNLVGKNENQASYGIGVLKRVMCLFSVGFQVSLSKNASCLKG